jgi:hypothetical protein
VRAAQVAMLWAHGAPSRDYSAGADHYHAQHVAPAWARRMQRVVVIGEHKFYQGTVNRMRSPAQSQSRLEGMRPSWARLALRDLRFCGPTEEQHET